MAAPGLGINSQNSLSPHPQGFLVPQTQQRTRTEVSVVLDTVQGCAT